MLALNIASTLYTLSAIIPYVNTSGSSLIYFGNISQMNINTFLNDFPVQQDSAVHDDMDKQIFYLANGLNKKFRRLTTAGKLLFVEAVVLIPLLICVTINLK